MKRGEQIAAFLFQYCVHLVDQVPDVFPGTSTRRLEPACPAFDYGLFHVRVHFRRVTLLLFQLRQARAGEHRICPELVGSIWRITGLIQKLKQINQGRFGSRIVSSLIFQEGLIAASHTFFLDFDPIIGSSLFFAGAHKNASGQQSY
jgi:hypothetical protein